MKKALWAIKLAGLGVLIASGQSWAGCMLRSSITQTGNFPTSFTLSTSQAVGTPIGSEITVPASSSGSITCSGGTTYALLRLNPDWSASSIANVYNTSIPGIGVMVWDDFLTPVFTPLTNNVQKWYSPGIDYNGYANLTNIKVQFYVTGTVVSGEYPAETIVEAWMNNVISTAGGANYVTLKLPAITVKALTCETPNISVNLDKHLSSEFSGINSKSAAKAFNFEIKKFFHAISKK